MAERTFKCPACGSDDVIADVTAWYREVPVHRDGYHPPDGKPDGDDLQHLRCGACGTGLRIIDWEEGEIKRALPEPKAVRFKIEEAIGWTLQQEDYLRGELIERAVDEVGRPPFGEEFEEWVGEVRVTDFHFLVILHPEPLVDQ